MKEPVPPSASTDSAERLPLSLLNDFIYCPRRAALEVIEEWREATQHTDALASFPDLRVLEGLTRRADAPSWSKCDAKTFLQVHAAGFARYREFVSGLEIQPNEVH